MRLYVHTVPDRQQIADMEMAYEDGGDVPWYVGRWTIPFASNFYAMIVAKDGAGNQNEMR